MSDNLKPVQTTEEARIRGHNGGIRSGEVRRAKKSMSEKLEIAMRIKRRTGKLDELDKIKTQKDLKDANITNEDEIVLSLINQARKGNMVAIQYVWELMGLESPDCIVTPLQELSDTIKQYKDADADEKEDE